MSTLSAFYNELDTNSALGMALCWEINRTDGTSLFFTNHDENVTASYDSVEKTFTPVSSFSGSAVKEREGTTVDNMSLVVLTSDDITEQDLLAGKYEEAEIIVYAVQWDQLANGLHILKRGYLGQVASKGAEFEVEVRGVTYKLQQNTGRLYTLECDANLGDSRCKVNVDSYYTVSTTVESVTSSRQFTVALTGEAATYFQYGKCTFTSGNNSGRALEILGHTVSGSDTIILLENAPYAIQVGDGVTLTAGCDKSATTCKAKFGNLLNFQGFPFIPTEDKALQTPNAK